MPDSGEAQSDMRVRSEGPNARLTVSISLKPRFGKEALKAKYGVSRYDLAGDYSMSESLKPLVPKNTPEYVDRGQNYVERLMRALYHFKQCALIGPSGTGKSVCEGEPVFVLLNGKATLTTVDRLFDELARTQPVSFDQDGWEVILLSKADLRVMSMDEATGEISWRVPHAIARSTYKGEIVEVTTSRNRTVRATPEHSFILEGGRAKASRVAPGAMIPIVRRIPATREAPMAAVSLLEYVPGARVTERGLVMGGRESIQIPAPTAIAVGDSFAWFLGFFVAEGYVGNGFASVCNEDRDAIATCTTEAASLGLATSVREQRGLVELRVFSKTFVAFLSRTTVSRRMGKGKGSQARYKQVPDFIFSAPDDSKVAFLRGYFEGDGWYEEGSELLLGTSSRELANGLLTLFGQLGIFATVRIKGDAVKSYSVAVARDGASRLGMRIHGSRESTDNRGHVEKIAITPQMVVLAKSAYRRLPVEARSKRFYKRTVSLLCSRTRAIGLNTLARIAREINSTELLRMAETNVLWDKVVRVKRMPYEGRVYDFQVPGTETFAAGFGGVLTHNTHIVYLIAELAGLPLWEINCGLQTSVYDMFGRFVGLGRENWVDGQIVSWCRYGGILYLDEANMMKQDVATRLNPLLDTRGHLVLTERDNEVIPRHPQGYVIISMNPYSAEFAGTKPLNAAFRRRMSVWLDFDYLSIGTNIAKDEVEMVSKRSGVPLDVAEKIIRVGAEVRRRYKSGDLPYGPSVGDLVNWATLVADGLEPSAAAEETLVSLTSDDPEVQTTVRRVVRMVLGDGKGVQG